MAFESLTEKLQNVFKNLRSKGRLTEEDVKVALKEVKMALLEADVNFKVVKQFIKTVEERAVGADVMNGLNPGQMVIKIVNEELIALMGSESAEIQLQPGKAITVLMMCGLQGAGKTTTTAKLAGKFKQKGKKCLLVACDVYRPAAIKQLQVNGEKQGVDVFSMGENQSPVDIAKAAIEHAQKNGHNLVILDTAGRLHIDEQMMTELKEIKENVEVHQTILVVDVMTGQDAVNVAKEFDEKVGIDGVILSKMDGDSRGGAALSVKAVTGKPIFYAGMGEKLSDLEQFYPDRMANRILGMGDVLTLIEKAQESMDIDEEKEKQMACGSVLILLGAPVGHLQPPHGGVGHGLRRAARCAGQVPVDQKPHGLGLFFLGQRGNSRLAHYAAVPCGNAVPRQLHYPVATVHLEGTSPVLPQQLRLAAFCCPVQVEIQPPLFFLPAKVHRHDVGVVPIGQSQPQHIALADDLLDGLQLCYFPVFPAHFFHSVPSGSFSLL